MPRGRRSFGLYALHYRYRPGDYETWKDIAPIEKAAWVHRLLRRPARVPEVVATSNAGVVKHHHAIPGTGLEATGASRGIGRAAALALANGGARVIIHCGRSASEGGSKL